MEEKDAYHYETPFTVIDADIEHFIDGELMVWPPMTLPIEFFPKKK